MDVRSSWMFHLDQSSSSALDLTCRRLSSGPDAAPTFLAARLGSVVTTTLPLRAAADAALDICAGWAMGGGGGGGLWIGRASFWKNRGHNYDVAGAGAVGVGGGRGGGGGGAVARRSKRNT
jgi:hypothetical protein